VLADTKSQCIKSYNKVKISEKICRSEKRYEVGGDVGPRDIVLQESIDLVDLRKKSSNSGSLGEKKFLKEKKDDQKNVSGR